MGQKALKADTAPKQEDDRHIMIGPCELRAAENTIIYRKHQIRLEPRVIQVLYLLSQYANEVVTREQLIDTVWLGRPVTDDAITRCISRLRKAFADELAAPIKIETVAKSGYRLIIDRENKEYTEIRSKIFQSILVVLVIGLGVFAFSSIWPTDEPSYRREVLVVSEQWQRYPEFSPDGSLLVYSEGNEDKGMAVMVRQVDGDGIRQLSQQQSYDHQPTFSPDGKNIAFASLNSEGCEIHLVPTIGGLAIGEGQTSVGQCGRAGVYDLQWLPDGKHLLMVTKDKPSETARLVSLSLESEMRQDVTPKAFAGIDDLAVSPGGKIAISVHYELGVEDVFVSDGKVPYQWRRITQDKVKIHGLAWRQDGDHLLFTSNRMGAFQLWEFDFDTENLKLIPEGLNGASAIASRVNGDIALERWREESAVKQVDLTSNDEKELVAAKGVNWDASFNQYKQLIYISDRTDSAELWLRKNGQDYKLSEYNGPWVMAPRWSPNGRYVAYMVPLRGSFSVQIFDTKRNKNITNFHVSDAFAPRWSGDGEGLYFGSKRSGEWQIWYRKIDEPDAKQITTLGGKTAQMSKDGSYLLVSKGNTPGIWKVPLSAPEQEQQIIHNLAPVDWNNWQLLGENVFYVQRPSHGVAVLNKFNLTDENDTKIYNLTNFLYFSGIHVDSKSNTFTYARTSYADADIDMLRRSH